MGKSNDHKGRKRNSKKGERKSVKGKYKKRGGVSSASKKAGLPKSKRTHKGEPLPKFSDRVRLNKFLSNAGICSRREADALISSGVVSVNGKIVTELGLRVSPSDEVKYDGITINSEKKRYVLLNKPKGFVVVPSARTASGKSALSLVQKACKEPLYPVGKMEKAACGLMLFTNDGDMEKKLTHPKFKSAQLFHVSLDRPMEQEDLSRLTSGMYVDEHMFSAEEASYVKGKPKTEVGISILSSKSNTVKLMMGKLGYEVRTMDRLEYAGLDKKDLPRGHYRHLSEKEVAFLKMS